MNWGLGLGYLGVKLGAKVWAKMWASMACCWPGARVMALGPRLAVSMQVMVSQPLGSMSESLAVSSDQGFQMTVDFELALQTVMRRLRMGSSRLRVATVLR